MIYGHAKGMTILIYRRNMNNYYLKITDIKIHIKSPFKIHMGIESKNFISKDKGEDILLE